MSTNTNTNTADAIRNDKAPVAFHEAGHAVVAVLVDIPFDVVTITPDEERGTLGHVMYEHIQGMYNIGRREFAAELRDYLTANRAGPIAEARYTGRQNEDGASGDDADFWSLLWRMYGERRDRHARDLTRRARRLVAEHWRDIERVAQALLERTTLTHSEVVHMLSDGHGQTERQATTGD